MQHALRLYYEEAGIYLYCKGCAWEKSLGVPTPEEVQAAREEHDREFELLPRRRNACASEASAH